MSDILFVVKVFLLTVLMVLVMQIKVGDSTIERHSQNWIRTSSLVHPLQDVAHGAVKVTTQVYRFVTGSVDKRVGKVFQREQTPGQRGLGNILRKKEKPKNENLSPESFVEEAVEVSQETAL